MIFLYISRWNISREFLFNSIYNNSDKNSIKIRKTEVFYKLMSNCNEAANFTFPLLEWQYKNKEFDSNFISNAV